MASAIAGFVSLDFFIGKQLKQILYDEKPYNAKYLQNKILQACQSITPETVAVCTRAILCRFLFPLFFLFSTNCL